MKQAPGNRSAKAAETNPRRIALLALGEILDEGRSLSDCPALKSREAAPEVQRNLSQARHLTYGVLRWQVALAWLEAQMLDRPLKQKDSDISRLIWLGLFQLWQDRTPDHAAINETTECARSLGKTWAVNLVNAVLRRFQREQSALLAKLAQVPEHWAHPDWLLQAMRKNWPAEWQSVLNANNQAPPLWIRVNTQAASLADIEAAMTQGGFTSVRSPYAGAALLLAPAAAVDDLPGFRDGHFSVQDAAAQLAAELLDVDPGMRVLDACAAPGGKTCHLLERYPGIALTAIDTTARRLRLVQENLARLRLQCSLVEADAADTAAWWEGVPFDRILLDAPCTATGVIRRHPEIRHLRDPAQLKQAVVLQSRLLRQLWPLLAPGGMLLYATCSVLQDENSHQIRDFLAEHPDAKEQAIHAAWGREQIHGRQILPGEGDMDGFYYARLRKPA